LIILQDKKLIKVEASKRLYYDYIKETYEETGILTLLPGLFGKRAGKRICQPGTGTVPGSISPIEVFVPDRNQIHQTPG
jgi:hypothetical protein